MVKQTRYSQGRSNSSQDCTNVDRTDPDFRDTVNATEDLLSYLQLLETGLPLLIVCLVRFFVILGLNSRYNSRLAHYQMFKVENGSCLATWWAQLFNRLVIFSSASLPPPTTFQPGCLFFPPSLHPSLGLTRWPTIETFIIVVLHCMADFLFGTEHGKDQ